MLITHDIIMLWVYNPTLDACGRFVVYANHEDYKMSQLWVVSECTFTQRSSPDLHGLPICFGAAPGYTKHKARNRYATCSC